MRKTLNDFTLEQLEQMRDAITHEGLSMYLGFRFGIHQTGWLGNGNDEHRWRAKEIQHLQSKAVVAVDKILLEKRKRG